MGNHFTRTFFLLFLLCSAYQGFPQAIHGIVLDNSTKAELITSEKFLIHIQGQLGIEERIRILVLACIS